MMTIIVADDEPTHREMVATILERAGYDVVTASNGRECLRYLEDTNAALVVTDIFMPGMDGLQLAATAGSRGIRIPMIAMTGGMGGHFEPFSELMRRLGAKCVLNKPFSPEELLTAVRRSLP